MFSAKALLSIAFVLIVCAGGWVLLRNGRQEAPATTLSEAAQFPPEYFAHWTRMRLGWRQSQAALDTANEGLARFPQDGSIYWARGKVWYALGRLESAIMDFDSAIRLSPGSSRFYTDRGLARFSSGDFAAAKADLVRATELDDQMPINHSNLAWFLATCPDESLRDGQAAVHHARKAVEMRPEYWLYHDTLAMACADISDFDAAIDSQKQAISDLSYEIDCWRQAGHSARNFVDEFGQDVADDLDKRLQEATQRLRLYERRQAVRATPTPCNAEYPRYNPFPL